MIRVCVVDDHGLFRDGVRALLASFGDIEVVSEATSARAGVRRHRALCSDVI